MEPLNEEEIKKLHQIPPNLLRNFINKLSTNTQNEIRIDTINKRRKLEFFAQGFIFC